VSHSYDRSHGHSSYSLEQLCAVALCGALGLVVVLLYFQRTEDNQKVLTFMLANAFVPPARVADLKPMSWVEVTGQIQYGKRKGLDQYIPVLKVRSIQDIAPTTREYPFYLE